jgi:RimJ/RimL family protein N-acetyltransferase
MDDVDPLLVELPAELLTRRLRLVPPAPGDGLMVNRAIAESFAELNRWMDWAATMPSVIESERFVRESAARYLRRDDLPLFIRKRDTGEFVGASGMHRIDWNVPRFEIGYWCRTSLVGQGYVTEAVIALTRFAFETLHAARIEIRTDVDNERSWHIAQRLGFTLEGILRRDARTAHGKLRDTRVYAITDLADLRSEGGAAAADARETPARR